MIAIARTVMAILFFYWVEPAISGSLQVPTDFTRPVCIQNYVFLMIRKIR